MTTSSQTARNGFWDLPESLGEKEGIHPEIPKQGSTPVQPPLPFLIGAPVTLPDVKRVPDVTLPVHEIMRTGLFAIPKGVLQVHPQPFKFVGIVNHLRNIVIRCQSSRVLFHPLRIKHPITDQSGVFDNSGNR